MGPTGDVAAPANHATQANGTLEPPRNTQYHRPVSNPGLLTRETYSSVLLLIIYFFIRLAAVLMRTPTGMGNVMSLHPEQSQHVQDGEPMVAVGARKKRQLRGGGRREEAGITMDIDLIEVLGQR